MPRKLDLWDFDGTLFHSPLDTSENRQKYEKATGVPWLIDKTMSRELSKKFGKFIGIRRGWFGREETLQPPLVPNPTPQEWFIKQSCEKFHKSKADPDCLTLILTGRHAGIKGNVLRILGDGKLVQVQHKKSKEGKDFYDLIDPDVKFLCLGEDGPAKKGNKPNETFPWKVWILEQFLEVYSEIEEVEIYEDRDEHIAKFKELELGIKITVNDVK